MTLLDAETNMNVFSTDDLNFDFSPLWSLEEMSQRQELVKATTGYQDLLTFSLYEPEFFEYLDKSGITNPTNSSTLFTEQMLNEQNVSLFSNAHHCCSMKHTTQLVNPATPLKHVSAVALEEATFGAAAATATAAATKLSIPAKMTKDESNNNNMYTQRVPQSARPTKSVNAAITAALQGQRKRKRSASKEEAAMLEVATGAKQSPKKRKKVQSDGQEQCCIKGCDMGVTNRLRFSLRCSTEFKGEFLERGWNKICHRHYFADLYRFKKQKKRAEQAGASH